MRLVRLVAAGLVLGVVVGFVTALVRPRGQDPLAGHHLPRDRGAERQLHHHPDAVPHASASQQPGTAGAGAGLPTRPIPLPTSALSGTGGAR